MAIPHSKYTIFGRQQKTSNSSGSGPLAQPNRLYAMAAPFLSIALKKLDCSGLHSAKAPAALKTFILERLNLIINKSPRMLAKETKRHPRVSRDLDLRSRQLMRRILLWYIIVTGASAEIAALRACSG